MKYRRLRRKANPNRFHRQGLGGQRLGPDFALQAEREQNLDTKESIYRACVLRFRPILMTTMAALLGGVPLMPGTGNGAELRQPLGYTIVGGLFLSQPAQQEKEKGANRGAFFA